MKNTGISLLSIIPMRAEPSEKSEMTSQLLFGEHFITIEQTEKWLHIRSGIDTYQGWIPANMASDFPDDFPLTLTPDVIRSPYVICSAGDRQIHLPGGSLIPATTGHSTFQLAGEKYTFCGGMTQHAGSSLARHALQYLNAPYLWGGKTIFGTDCSGLVQIVCRMAGHRIPRDAAQQVFTGREVTPGAAAASDIAFFNDDNGKIIHTGILCSAGSITHASGHVRIDRFDEQGIFNEAANRYTHRLHSVRRL